MSLAKQAPRFLKLVMKEIYTFCLKDIWKIIFSPFFFFLKLKWMNQKGSQHFPCFIHLITCGVGALHAWAFLRVALLSVSWMLEKWREGACRSEAWSRKQSRTVWRWRQTRGGARLNVSAAIKLIAVADTVIDTRLSFAANIVGACRRIFYSVSIENKPRQLHLIPRTSAPEEVINYHIGNIDSFINPTLMALESKKCCIGFFLDTFSYYPHKQTGQHSAL